jgi:hypothetical protein
MTDQPTEQSSEQPSRASGTTPSAAASPGAEPTAEPTARQPSFEERMDAFGRRAGEAGERFGREAEAAANRWARDPAVVGATDAAARIWGLLVLAVGLWFLADVTLGFDMPEVAWRDLWPVALIAIGLAVVLRGVARRRT